MAEPFKSLTCNPKALSSIPSLTASWICSRQSQVEILGHPCKIANWFTSDLNSWNSQTMLSFICFIIPEKPHKGKGYSLFFFLCHFFESTLSRH